MPRKKFSQQLFYRYYARWVKLYKVGAVRKVTLEKYELTTRQIQALVPSLRLNELDRQTYQELINSFAINHERQTTMDFHHHVKAAIIDAFDEGVIGRDPTRRVVIKGKTSNHKKKKFLSLFELQLLLKDLNLETKVNWDWFILLVAKPGLHGLPKL